MRFVLTIEAEHSQHVNAINFFFLVAATWNNGGEAANEDKQRDKGLNTKRRERALTIETDYSQHQHVNVIFFFFLFWQQPVTMVEEEQQTETKRETKA